MRCGKCGNDNSDTNRFCGMCGAALVAKTASPEPVTPVAVVHGEKTAGPAPAEPSAAPRLPTRAATAPTPMSASPVITGPSFLGLNKPADGPKDRAGAYAGHRSSPDPLARSSGNLDYLLEDEEEPKRGWGKLAVVVIALALAGGFGYLHWKQGGFDWLTASDKKPAATTQAAESPQSAPDSGSATNTAANPSGTVPEAAAGATATPPAASGTAPATTEPAAAQTAAPAQVPQANPTDSNPPANPPTDSAAQPADNDSATQAPVAEAPAAPKARAPKPSPIKPVDPATEAERYIYGHGVRQDCDRGLRLLKPAAEQANPKAMIALGALYSTGTCTPRDLPTAYRWFALALHKQPDNQPLQDDLQKLWSQMTQPERQLAIKLSQ